MDDSQDLMKECQSASCSRHQLSEHFSSPISFFSLMACFEFWDFIHVLVVLVWFRMELPKRLFSILEMFYAKFEGS